LLYDCLNYDALCNYVPANNKSKYLSTLDAGVGNLVNVMLDAILVFPLGLGVRGAALATVTSEYVEFILRISCVSFVGLS